MKKRQLIRAILAAGFQKDRDSQRHERYRKGEVVISIGRHDSVKPWEVRDAQKKMQKNES